MALAAASSTSKGNDADMQAHSTQEAKRSAAAIGGAQLGARCSSGKGNGNCNDPLRCKGTSKRKANDKSHDQVKSVVRRVVMHAVCFLTLMGLIVGFIVFLSLCPT